MAAVVIVALLFFVPVNAISFIAYFNTPTEAMYTADEEAVAAWVREHTSRKAVFIDRNDAAVKLAERLENYRGKNPLVLGIPRGGDRADPGIDHDIRAAEGR